MLAENGRAFGPKNNRALAFPGLQPGLGKRMALWAENPVSRNWKKLRITTTVQRSGTPGKEPESEADERNAQPTADLCRVRNTTIATCTSRKRAVKWNAVATSARRLPSVQSSARSRQERWTNPGVSLGSLRLATLHPRLKKSAALRLSSWAAEMLRAGHYLSTSLWAPSWMA